ncbi:alpha/beta fold hydrolase [Bradyrhizobium sp. Arg237L]|uniref:alpha/beta hydrolase n=1 Tax=Bradyrhizobium sp. Arg237L TaxID=3003352 RepID=UPI00249E57F5|nr:alpha/beta fold hydrolase [Bradyrhizobium sp. Arg237L]MDI4236746.1 alpha/beta fold hydrolase [Bradyrhizobium sp. Arg237L]
MAAAAAAVGMLFPSFGQTQELQRDKVAGEAAPALVVELRLHSGMRQRLLYISPPKPLAAIVMLPGGGGNIGIESNGDVRHGDNFVVRSRELWVQRGYAVVIPDTTAHANLRRDRSTPEYGRIVVELADFARSQAGVPVFLLGTSQGSIAAVNGAAHAPGGDVSGLVLTESVSRMGKSGETVFSAEPENVRVPVLIVANRSDRCNVAAPGDAPRIAAAMSHSPEVQVRFVSGGISRSRRACGSLSPHGYYGIETRVVDLIARWISEHR